MSIGNRLAKCLNPRHICTMSDPFFFGYGSLVNIDTHSYRRTAPAKVTGWRRAWRHTQLRDVAFLTVVPDETAQIEGLIAAVPNADWAALDEREAGYSRQRLESSQISHEHLEPVGVELYETRTDLDASTQHPILLSYLDVVVQGYARVFGQDGAARFFETTSGWDAPILDDRANPQYPRHKILTKAESDLVNDHLSALSARVEKL